MKKNSVPILFLIFNRPANTKSVFDAIRHHKPQYLYIAADGPREEIPGEKEICEQTRQIALQTDWDCEVKTLFRQNNLGCKLAVSEAINWFFEHVDEGIILEDDCLPDASFFPFCGELLEKFRWEGQVMSVSGSNILGRPWKSETQSYFWGHGGIWGWATWRRAWNLYDIDMKGWQDQEIKAKIRDAIGTDDWYNTYYNLFESSFNGSLKSWDIQWFYSILVNNGIAINPSVNLVKNIGFGAGTHTNTENNYATRLPLCSMIFPLKHPENITTDVEFLKLAFTTTHGQSTPKINFFKRFFRFINRNGIMKKLIKKMITWMVVKTNFPQLLSQVQEKQHFRSIQYNVTNHGATFYAESSVTNGQGASNITVGQGTHIRGNLVVFKYGGEIVIGENCYVGDHTRIWSGESVKIGDFVQISHNVNIMDTNAHEIDAIERADRYLAILKHGAWADKGNVLTAPIVINDYAWISLNATILKGVTIGEGAIVGANAVVTKDVPPYTLVTGNPAAVVKVLQRK